MNGVGFNGNSECHRRGALTKSICTALCGRVPRVFVAIMIDCLLLVFHYCDLPCQPTPSDTPLSQQDVDPTSFGPVTAHPSPPPNASTGQPPPTPSGVCMRVNVVVCMLTICLTSSITIHLNELHLLTACHVVVTT